MMTNDIASRMQDYFARQIAWSESALDALTGIELAEDETEVDRIVLEDARRAHELETLEREFMALKKEWDAADGIAAEERDAVRAVARRAKALGNEVQAKMDGALDRLRRRADSEAQEVGELRRGRRHARKFSSGDESSGGFVDRQA